MLRFRLHEAIYVNNAKSSKSRKSKLGGEALGMQTVRETVTCPRKNVLLLNPTPLDSESHDHSVITSDNVSEDKSRSVILESRTLRGKGLDYSDSESQGIVGNNPSTVMNETTSVSDKPMLSSKSGLSSLEEINVSSKSANRLNLRNTNSKAPSGTPGSLKNVKVTELRKTKNEAGKAKELKTDSSSPKRLVKKASVVNTKSPKNRVGKSVIKNEKNSVKLKPVLTSSNDVPEKTLYIIESSVNARSVDLSPSYTSSSEDKNSKLAQKGIGNGRSPPSIEKRSLRYVQKGTPKVQSVSLLTSSPKKKVSRLVQPGARIASPMSGRVRSSLKKIETDSNQQKVLLKKTPVTRRLLPPSGSFSEKVILRHTQFGHPVSPPSTPPTSVISSLYSSRSTVSSHPCDNESETEKLNPKAENNTRTRKNILNSSKNEDSVAQKLSFRRGKVIEPQCDVSPPRRLKFRRRVLVDSIFLKGDAGSRSFAKKMDDEGKIGSDRIPSNLTRKVNLKRQDVSQKRDAKTLFNNVIEETASKLVETRKSRVKALVGAFETVISLQV